MTPLVAILSILAISAGGSLLADRLRFRHFWNRGCLGYSWLATFPSRTKAEIRDFLEIFAKAFLFGRSRRLSFAPGDRVLEVYRTRYPIKNWPDAMELEIFAQQLKKRYGVDLTSCWREDITLGEIFERVTRRAA